VETTQQNAAGIDQLAFSISEFCQAHRISVAKYYLLRAAGEAPVEMKVGARRLISVEAAAAWRRQMEQEQAA
jgi:hypothetical protein